MPTTTSIEPLIKQLIALADLILLHSRSNPYAKAYAQAVLSGAVAEQGRQSGMADAFHTQCLYIRDNLTARDALTLSFKRDLDRLQKQFASLQQ